LSIEETQAGASLQRYDCLAFVIGGMVVGFAACLAYSCLEKAEHGPGHTAAGASQTDEPIVQTALTDEIDGAPLAFLGVELVSVDALVAEQLGLAQACGVLVNSVVDSSPAQRAGLQGGDCLLSLNNIAIENVDGFREMMAQLDPGDQVRIIYLRDGQKDAAYATLANSSAATAIADSGDTSDWGVSLAVLGSDLRAALRISDDIDGIVILSVKPGGLADEAGLQAGDVIVGIDNTPIANMNDFLTALAASDDDIALLDIYSRGQLRFVALDSSSVAELVQQSRPSLLDKIVSLFTDDHVILTEHENEEDDYEKPVCKRLEESGDRYPDED